MSNLLLQSSNTHYYYKRKGSRNLFLTNRPCIPRNDSNRIIRRCLLERLDISFEDLDEQVLRLISFDDVEATEPPIDLGGIVNTRNHL